MDDIRIGKAPNELFRELDDLTYDLLGYDPSNRNLNHLIQKIAQDSFKTFSQYYYESSLSGSKRIEDLKKTTKELTDRGSALNNIFNQCKKEGKFERSRLFAAFLCIITLGLIALVRNPFKSKTEEAIQNALNEVERVRKSLQTEYDTLKEAFDFAQKDPWEFLTNLEQFPNLSAEDRQVIKKAIQENFRGIYFAYESPNEFCFNGWRAMDKENALKILKYYETHSEDNPRLQAAATKAIRQLSTDEVD